MNASVLLMPLEDERKGFSCGRSYGRREEVVLFLGYGGFKVNLQKLFATLLTWTGFRLS